MACVEERCTMRTHGDDHALSTLQLIYSASVGVLAGAACAVRAARPYNCADLKTPVGTPNETSALHNLLGAVYVLSVKGLHMREVRGTVALTHNWCLHTQLT